MQCVAYIVISAPSGRGKTPVCDKNVSANIACEELLDTTIVTQVCQMLHHADLTVCYRNRMPRWKVC